jgi:superfamily I DNA/RNA helicase
LTGTGKTATLLALLQSLHKCRLLVHACAPTNVAVCELARRSLTAFVNADTSNRLADLLLVGTEKLLKLQDGDPLQRLLLSSRVRRIKVACGEFQKHAPGLLADMRTHSYHRTAAAQGTSDASADQQALGELHNRITTSAGILRSVLPVLAHEAPLGTVSDLALEDMPQLLDHLQTLQTLSLEQFMLWGGLPPTTATVVNARDSDVQEDLDAFASVYCTLKGISVNATVMGERDVFRAASLVFSTVNVGGRKSFSSVDFDVVVVDEATQLLQSETAIVLRRKLRCLVLAGDDKQLPATVLSPRSEQLGYGESLFSRLLKCKYPYVLLNTQYRMHPEISHWPRVQFYNGDVVNGPNVVSSAYTKPWHAAFPPLEVFDLTTGREEVHEHGSKFNEAEAILVRRTVRELHKLHTPLTVGVIVPYAAQLSLLKDLSRPSDSPVKVRVSTVDGFQGQECDVIIFSTVRSNNKDKIGFLEDERRLNVAVTRAKYALVIICNVKTMSSSPVWESLFDHARSRVCLSDAGTKEVIMAAALKYEKGEDRIVKLNYEDVFEKSTWRVLFCGDFRTSLAKISDQTKRYLIKKALGLAAGEWPKFEFVDSSVPERLQGVLHVHRVLQYRLIWSVDVDRKKHEQCLCLWDVVQTSEVVVAVRRVTRVLSTYSSAYLERCAQKQSTPSLCARAANVSHHPAHWKPDKDFTWLRDSGSAATVDATAGAKLERGSIGTSAVLTKIYRLNSNVARLFTSSNSFASIELPFKMSNKEEAIVRHQGSLLVLGRSGTGKTTVILHRMLLLREHHRLIVEQGDAAVDSAPPTACRQLLVTASPILCEAIRRSYRNMCHTSDKLADTCAKDEAPALSACEQTFAHFDGGAGGIAPPQTFEKCQPSDFPLILTYTSFLKMLDASLEDPFFRGEDSTGNEVTFMRFSTHYYPRFSAEVSKQADAALVYTEIMSHIKGSHAALHTAAGHLSKEDYLVLSNNHGSHQRGMLYDVFERYEKMKAQLYPGDYDSLDIVHHIYRTLSRAGAAFRGALMTSVSVDEVQDLVPAQIALFKFVCASPAGFVFAGDTAQTIAHGVGFRFETLKDIFYQEFLSGYSGTKKAELVPELTYLSENFRTHAGVVSIANSVVQLVTEFFPWSIDKLKPERSLVAGPAPLFISSGEDAVTALFGGNNACDFGPEQVILVRDEETKRKVRKLCATRALVLTVQECKGMEFTDCLVYNFFSSSPLKNDWRVLYEAIDPAEPHPAFDENKHSALCVELKSLYVLLTRARQRLIIYDSDLNSREPLLRYWRTKQLVEEKPLDQDIRNLFLAESNPEQWQELGRQLFERQNYSDARLCYKRAGDTFHEELCDAAELELDGDKVAVASPPGARALYKEAAQKYLKLEGYKHKAAQCSERAGEFALAAGYFTDISRHGDAGRCFERGAIWTEAAQAYDSANDVENALRCCYKQQDFERGREMLSSFRTRKLFTEANYATRLEGWARKAALHFHSRKELVTMIQFVDLFRDTNEKRTFLRRYGHSDLLLQIEISGHCFAPAARICEETYDFANAKAYYEKAGMPTDAVRCLIKSVRLELLDEHYGIAALPPEARTLLEEARITVAALPVNTHFTHTKMLDLLLLLPNTGAGKMDTYAAITGLTDLIGRLAKFGTGAAWPVHFSALIAQLRFILLNNTLLSSDQCQTCTTICQDLRRLTDFVAPALAAMTADRPKPLSSSHNRILQQCLDYFEFSAAAYITSSTQVECLRTVKGLAKVFGIAVDSAPASRAVSVGIKKFCQCAQYYFKTEVAEWVRRCGEACARALEALPVALTFGQRAAGFLLLARERPAPNALTLQRFRLLSSCYYNLAVTVELATSAATGKVEQQRISEALMDILLPADPFMQSAWDLGAGRTMDPALVSDLINNLHTTQAMRQLGLRYEEHARALLTAELGGSKSTLAVIDRLRGVLESEVAKSRRLGRVVRPSVVLSNLIEGFAWENASAAAVSPVSEGPFFYGIQCLANCLIVDVQKRSGGLNAMMFGDQHTDTSGCIFPTTFLKLARKCVVALVLHWKSFRDVVLPTSLAVDQLVRRSGAYERAVQEYGVDGFAGSKVSRNRSCGALRQLKSLVSVLFYLLDTLTSTTFGNWDKHEAAKTQRNNNEKLFRDARAQKIKNDALSRDGRAQRISYEKLFRDDQTRRISYDKLWRDAQDQKKKDEELCRDARDSFFTGTIELAMVFLINMHRDDPCRAIFCKRIANLVFCKTSGSLARYLPLYYHRLLVQLARPQGFLSATSAFYQDTQNPLLLVHCTHSCAATVPFKFGDLKATRMILEASSGAVLLVPHRPPPAATAVAAEPPQEEEAAAPAPAGPGGEADGADAEQLAVEAPREMTHEIRLWRFFFRARRWAMRARVRLENLTPRDELERHVEREFFLAAATMATARATPVPPAPTLSTDACECISGPAAAGHRLEPQQTASSEDPVAEAAHASTDTLPRGPSCEVNEEGNATHRLDLRRSGAAARRYKRDVCPLCLHVQTASAELRNAVLAMEAKVSGVRC